MMSPWEISHCFSRLGWKKQQDEPNIHHRSSWCVRRQWKECWILHNFFKSARCVHAFLGHSCAVLYLCACWVLQSSSGSVFGLLNAVFFHLNWSVCYAVNMEWSTHDTKLHRDYNSIFGNYWFGLIFFFFPLRGEH